MRIVIDRSARVLAGGTVVIGGQPARLLQLTPAGGRLVCAWRDGAAVRRTAASERLARRLITAGLAHPLPDQPGPWTADDVALVIPARDRADLLARCLSSAEPARELVVVDDGSLDRTAITSVAAAAGAAVVRHERARGPAQARNTGATATTAPLIAFADSDVQLQPGWIVRLIGHFVDPQVGAVAPRVRVPAGGGAVSAYEAARSPLDLGGEPGVAGPGRRVGYVPATALVVRRSAFDALGGFDPGLAVGEDVDLAWRLSAAGWTVRYEPSVIVEHPARSHPGAWLGQRFAYGSSAGPLARRHPDAMRHLVVPRWALAPWLLAAAGRPRAGLLAASVGTGFVAARLPAPPGARLPLLGFVAVAQLRIGRQVLDAGWRAYPPLLAGVVAARPRRWRSLAAGLGISIVADWITQRPRLDLVRYGALRTADDLSYAAGVWFGCIRARTASPLVPKLVSGPGGRRSS